MSSIRKVAVAGALVGAAVTGGALGASLFGTANAESTTPAATSSTAPSGSTSGSTSSGSNSSGNTAPTAPDQGGQRGPGGPGGNGGGGPHQANGITETPLTGDALAKATAAAKAALPGATVTRAETDADGAKYEVHMTKSDGSVATVKLDANFKVVSTEDGMH